MAIDWSGCLICDLLNAVTHASLEANRNREAAQRLRKFSLKGLDTRYIKAYETRASELEIDLATLKRHPCKGSQRLQG